MSDLLFKRGQLSGLNALKEQGKIENGTIYFTTDEGGMYIGLDSTTAKRVQGSVIYYETAQEFLAETKPPYSSDVLYFIANNKFVDGEYEAWNALIRWDATAEKFVQINVTASTVEALTARVDSQDTVITNVRDALGFDVTTGKYGKLDALDAKDKAIDAEIAGIKDTLENVATTEGLGELRKTVEGHTTAIETINSTIGTIAAGSSVSGLIKDLQDNKADKTALNGLSGTVSSLSNKVDGIDSTVQTQGENIQANATAINTINNTTIPGLRTAINEKANISTVEALDAELAVAQGDIVKNTNSINAVSKFVNANKTAVENLQSRAKSLEDRAAALEEASAKHVEIETYNEHIENFNTLSAEVSKKAATTELTRVEDIATGNATAIEEVKGTLATKANASDVTSLESTLNGKIATANEKITENADDIKELQTQISGIGSNSAAIEALDDRIDGIDDEISGIKEDISGINTALDGKAAQSAVDTINNTLGTVTGGSVGEQLSGHSTAITQLQAKDDELAGKISSLEGADATLQANINKKADQSALDATNKTVAEHTTAINSHTTAIEALQNAGYLDEADKTELLGKITSEINAANAMTYKGGLSEAADFTEVKESGTVSIGDTYIITEPFGDTVLGQLYAGDLIVAGIAKNKTEVNGYIPTADLEWIRVDTGYIEAHEATLDVKEIEENESAMIRLSSHTATKDENKGNLGRITINGSENVTIKASGDLATGFVLDIGMQWGSF